MSRLPRASDRPLTAVQYSAQDYACLRVVTEPLLTHLMHYHEQHDERFTSWLKHFDAILWLKLALVHLRQGLAITVEYDLRQYLALSASVGLSYFQRHTGQTAPRD